MKRSVFSPGDRVRVVKAEPAALDWPRLGELGTVTEAMHNKERYSEPHLYRVRFDSQGEGSEFYCIPEELQHVESEDPARHHRA